MRHCSFHSPPEQKNINNYHVLIIVLFRAISEENSCATNKNCNLNYKNIIFRDFLTIHSILTKLAIKITFESNKIMWQIRKEITQV